MISIEDQLKCVKRELSMRQIVYPKRVAEGRMTQTQANNETNAMRAVYLTLQGIKKSKDSQCELFLQEGGKP